MRPDRAELQGRLPLACAGPGAAAMFRRAEAQHMAKRDGVKRVGAKRVGARRVGARRSGVPSGSAARAERDSFGELRVPEGALWGAQTQRAIENFPLSGLVLPPRFLQALGRIKAAAAHANAELGLLPQALSAAISKAALEIAHGAHLEQFPVDVFQTGSGTSSNMNANEVIAHLASTPRRAVHPNDHVNMSQSSNDVVPTAIQVAAALALKDELHPALAHLKKTIDRRAKELARVVKTGRDRKSTRLNSSHVKISYAVFCLKKKKAARA